MLRRSRVRTASPQGDSYVRCANGREMGVARIGRVSALEIQSDVVVVFVRGARLAAIIGSLVLVISIPLTYTSPKRAVGDVETPLLTPQSSREKAHNQVFRADRDAYTAPGGCAQGQADIYYAATRNRLVARIGNQVLCCWLAAEANGQRFQQQRLEQTTTGRRPQQKPDDAPYYQDALPRSAPAIPRYYPPAPVHYVSIGEKLDGEYRFGYDSGNGPLGHSYRQEFRLPDGSIRGSYGYVDSRGHMRRVHYTAGKNGFVILKDERILDKEPPKDTLLGKDDLLTTSAPAKKDDVPQRHQQLLPRAPQFQEESRNVETQQSPRAQVAPVPLPSKSAQEIQAEYFRSQLYASGTVAREQYAEPDAAAQPAAATEEQPPQQPLHKPRIARPRTHRRRKRPKKTTTTTSTTTEAPAEEAKSEEVSGAEEPPSAAEAPEPQPSPAPQRPSSILRPRKLHRPPLTHLPPPGQRQTSVQGPPPLQSPPLEQGPQLAQFPIPEVRRPAQIQRVGSEQHELPPAQRPAQGHGAPQVIQRHRRPPATAAPPPVQERQPERPRDIEVHRAPQRFGSAQRQTHVVREPEVQRAPPARAEPAVEPYVPPPSLIDSTHGIPGRANFGFGQRLSAKRTSQTIVAQSDQSRDPDVQVEERPTASPRHRSRYQTTRRTRRPTLSIESEFPDFPVTRAPHRAAAGLPSKRRRVKVSRPLKLSQVAAVEEVTTPAPTTTTTPEPPPTTTSSLVTPTTHPVVTVASSPGLVTPVFPSAEQSFYRTHGLPQGPYNTYGQGVTLPQQPFTQPSPFTPPVTVADTPTVTPPPKETPAPVDRESDSSPQNNQEQPNTVVSQQGPVLGQPGAFPLPPRSQFGQPSFLPGQAPPHLNSPFPQRPIYQLPGFDPGRSPPVPQHYFPPLGAPFVPRNSTFVQNVPVPDHPRTVTPESSPPPQRNRTSEAFPLPIQRSFVDASGAAQGGFGQQRPALANPFSAVQPAHVFGPPPGSVPPFGGFPNQYPGDQFRGGPAPGLLEPQFRGQAPLSLQNQAAAAVSQTTPSQQQNSFATEATPGVTPANELGTTPLSLSSTTPAEGQYVDDVGTTLQLPTPAPPSASSLSTLSGERTTAAPFEYQTSRPPVLQYQTPSRPSEQFATSPAVPPYQTTPRPAPQFQQSLEPQQRTTPAPQSQPSGPGAPPSSQSHFRLGTPQQQQQNAIGAQPQFNSIGGAQQGYDPYQQQFGGGYQVGNNLFNPVQQTSQDLGGGYQYPDSGPFQAQFGGPYQPQYTTVDDYSQYQASAGLGDIRGSGTSQQGYRATTPPIVDRTLLSYDIGVPYRS
ncbi:hypothetical protein HPB50_007825 [Hyalomma asiaticum]|uniref:Uncharacterized protein n=1 Tax=Hyalomma asiaticum TaxID=266040 RepID=A0ACB7SCI1_HYAAI|nr:hypothetical protein HPB50_007825 [Hyalomma asiaticum]